MYLFRYSTCQRGIRLRAVLLCFVLVTGAFTGLACADASDNGFFVNELSTLPQAAMPSIDAAAPAEAPPFADAATPGALDTDLAPEPSATLLPLARGANFWEEPEQGFEVARFPGVTAHGREMDIMVVRIDPEFFDFVVLAATMPGEQMRTLQDWAARHNLSAAINAGMFLPDSLTHTGYLRVKDHENNGRVVSRFGAFFVSNPKESGLPAATVIDRTVAGQEELLGKYESAVQNYRMISAGRKLLWRESPQVHAIAAVGMDGKGRILFIHCREPITGVDFGNMLLALPLDVRQVMYVEGGTQAGLYARPGGSQIRMGRHPADFWTDGGVKTLLPNIIGAKPKGR